MRQITKQKRGFFHQAKQTGWYNFFSVSFSQLRRSFCLLGPSCDASASQWVGACLGPHPAGCAHLPELVHHGLCNIARDINNESWSRNHRGEHKRDREGSRRPQLALLQVSSFDTVLMVVWWVHMGQHEFMRTCLHNIYGVYAKPTNPFLLSSEGGFSCGTLLRKKQLRIPKHHTTMGDIIGAMCVPCPSQFLSGMSWLFLICTQPNPPTEKPQIEWRREGGMSGHNCLLWSSNSSVLA